MTKAHNDTTPMLRLYRYNEGQQNACPWTLLLVPKCRDRRIRLLVRDDRPAGQPKRARKTTLTSTAQMVG